MSDQLPQTQTSAPLDVAPDRLPRHIAVIMDGNGRWAHRRNLPRIEGHRRGAQSVRRVTEECTRLGIEQLTLYCLSSENWKRPNDELEWLMHLLRQYLVDDRESMLELNIRLEMIGRRDGIPAVVCREMDESIAISRNNTGTCLCLAINYGARREVVDAVRAIGEKIRAGQIECDKVNEQTIGDHLYTAGMPDPDLVIRTAGEMRISNFLLWQISYAEMWVTRKCWPDFDETDLHQAIRDFAARDRRYGGLNA